MTFDLPMSVLSAFAAGSITFFGWLAQRTVAHQTQIKHLDEKIDRLGDKIDTAIIRMDSRMDRMDDIHRDDMKRMDEKWEKMDAKWERLFERLLLQDQQQKKS